MKRSFYACLIFLGTLLITKIFTPDCETVNISSALGSINNILIEKKCLVHSIIQKGAFLGFIVSGVVYLVNYYFIYEKK